MEIYHIKFCCAIKPWFDVRTLIPGQYVTWNTVAWWWRGCGGQRRKPFSSKVIVSVCKNAKRREQGSSARFALPRRVPGVVHVANETRGYDVVVSDVPNLAFSHSVPFHLLLTKERLFISWNKRVEPPSTQKTGFLERFLLQSRRAITRTEKGIHIEKCRHRR